VDEVTWAAYGQDLEDNLRGLHERLHAGRYRARPTRRVYIPKADGRLRPLGIAALEDKILQRAVVEVLNAIYEADFRGFSYGFRPGRGVNCQIFCHLLTTLSGTVGGGGIERDAPSRVPNSVAN
jgi:retron-type reverse transcriptase